LGATNLATLVLGDIGQNELTGTSKVYALGSVALCLISGTATFFKRVNGSVLDCKVDNTPAGGMHPGHIHANTAVQGGWNCFLHSIQ
jgi:hypothetical protein